MSYEKYFKDVSGYDVIDVYRAHRIFGLTDEVLCHASKKLLLSGVRTGGKTLEQDVREARDSLDRWLEMLQEDLGNAQEKDGWTPEAIKQAAFDTVIPVSAAFKPDCEYTLEQVIGDAELSDWARRVAVDRDGNVYEYSREVAACALDKMWKRCREDRRAFGFQFRLINKIPPPADFTKCIWEIKK
jgi:hypothetical protein